MSLDLTIKLPLSIVAAIQAAANAEAANGDADIAGVSTRAVVEAVRHMPWVVQPRSTVSQSPTGDLLIDTTLPDSQQEPIAPAQDSDMNDAGSDASADGETILTPPPSEADVTETTGVGSENAPSTHSPMFPPPPPRPPFNIAVYDFPGRTRTWQLQVCSSTTMLQLKTEIAEKHGFPAMDHVVVYSNCKLRDTKTVATVGDHDCVPFLRTKLILPI